MIPAYYLANKRGVPRIESTGVSATSTQIVYTFRNHPNFTTAFNGLVIVRLNQEIPTGSTALPVVFSSDSGTINLTSLGGAAVTGATLAGTGIYLCYYDQQSSTLQLLTA